MAIPPAHLLGWVDLGPLSAIGPGLSRVCLGSEGICLVRQGDALHALVDECNHAGAPLSQGWLTRGQVVCPWHHFRYDPATGAAIHPSGSQPQGRYRLRVERGRVWLSPHRL